MKRVGTIVAMAVVTGVIGCTSMAPRQQGTALAAAVVAVSGCATLPKDLPRTESHAWAHPDETAIGRTFAQQLAAHPGLSAVRLLPVGVDAFAARVALAESAQRTLDLQYYTV